MSTPILEGKVAYVTGATRGIGWAIARIFAVHGASVVLGGHLDRPTLDAKVAELARETGAEVSGVLGDVGDGASVRATFQAIFREHRRLDVLVNNAGTLGDGLIGMLSDEQIERVLATNAKGPILNLQAAARLMARGEGGSIVNVTSIVGVHGRAGQSLYSASKAAVTGLTLSAAKELAPQGIRVNAIAPGFIETDMTRDLGAEARAGWTRDIRMGRAGTPDDVARVALFFASDQSAYVTGQILGVDGGLRI